jgi:excisionase family DNA binding protein
MKAVIIFSRGFIMASTVSMQGAGEYLGVGISVIKKMIADGKIKAIKISERTIRISKNELKVFVKEKETFLLKPPKPITTKEQKTTQEATQTVKL